MDLQQVTLLGLGEAGSAMAHDLLAADVQVRAYDPDPARQVDGVTSARDEADAVTDSQIVFSVNWSRVSLDVARRVRPALHPGQIYAELNTSSPDKKKAVAEVLGPGALVADVALMSSVPGKGIRTPMLVSGPGAERFAELLRPLNGPVTVLNGPVGLAASRKLARSVFFKGLAAAVGEALEAAGRMGPEAEEALRADIAQTLKEADERTVDRLQEGSRLHAVRREEEMAAAAEMLRAQGLDPLMAEATRAWLARLAGGEEPTAP
ncbi:NAD(P)-dependent oxidoreductase [Deinococcus aestuarii]|uniref:NAD(P)-dependent oxidoreductase n=1 Tax=Deinococcus aestuarii TaxID=2774531 RepID=UPI001C0E6EA1|nr:NAD(P)-dependent oxidoreductase [Deinococcus aestuarii]